MPEVKVGGNRGGLDWKMEKVSASCRNERWSGVGELGMSQGIESCVGRGFGRCKGFWLGGCRGTDAGWGSERRGGVSCQGCVVQSG